jgi:ubiquinone/menaquinone biosynthesis C-methylase UbiE
MRKDIFFEIHQGLPREGPGRNEYTKKAYEMLPKMDQPKILDIGCGPGGPTIELARMSGGDVFGMDTHQSYLAVLEERINQLRAKYKENPETLRTLNSEQEEIDLYRKYSAWYGSVFYVMQKL